MEDIGALLSGAGLCVLLIFALYLCFLGILLPLHIYQIKKEVSKLRSILERLEPHILEHLRKPDQIQHLKSTISNQREKV